MLTEYHLRIVFFGFVILSGLQLVAQPPAEKMIKVVVSPDQTNWNYKRGEHAMFTISVTKDTEPVHGCRIHYTVGPEMMPPVIEDSAVLHTGIKKIDGGTMKQPGLLRCSVTAEYNGNKYYGLATAAFDSELIETTTVLPEDFIQFWNEAKNKLASIPLDGKLKLLPERCTDKVNVYEANIQNFGYDYTSRLYGILCVPKDPGKYPALIRFPGAGVRPYTGDVSTAEKGIITFEIGIHGIPVTMGNSLYRDLNRSAFNKYPLLHLDHRSSYYYKRVYLGCIRAIDFIFSLSEFDGVNLAVTGASQGGALSIVASSLDSRIKYLAAVYPALCELTGNLHGRAYGWPYMFKDVRTPSRTDSVKIETSRYYDVVNFARFLKIPGFYTWGYNDTGVAPTSMFAAYNVITAPKELFIVQETGHWTYPEQDEKVMEWLLDKLLGRK